MRDLPDLEDGEIHQLALGLDLPEVEMEGVSPEEARLRSETARHALEGAEGNTPIWLADYYMLRDKGWPWRQAAYIAWASTPTDGRTPRTQDELARQLGLTSDRAISTWRRRNPAILETIAFLQSAPLWRHRADAFANLIQGMQAAGSDYKFFNHLKLYLEMTGDYVPTSKYMAELRKKISTDPSELSDEEIEMLSAAYEAYEVKKAQDKAGEEDASSPSRKGTGSPLPKGDAISARGERDYEEGLE